MKWAVCTETAERPAGEPVYRCNVNFGDPHVVVYCAAVIEGRLRAAEWRLPIHGRQDRREAARECATRLGARGG